MNFSNETLMWIGIIIWVSFAVFAAIGYYVGKNNTVALPSGNSVSL